MCGADSIGLSVHASCGHRRHLLASLVIQTRTTPDASMAGGWPVSGREIGRLAMRTWIGLGSNGKAARYLAGMMLPRRRAGSHPSSADVTGWPIVYT
jgi:hypothetical protein